jgi:Bor protein
VFGLVPPSTVETAAKCPNGVAKVETQLSFLNQLVSVLTLSIYTPMTIEVTCASGKGVADGPRPAADLTVARADATVAAH